MDYKLSLFLYDMLQNNITLDNLERVCLYEAASGTNAIVDLFYSTPNNINLHKYINLSEQYQTIKFMAKDIFNPDDGEPFDIRDFFNSDNDNVKDDYYERVTTALKPLQSGKFENEEIKEDSCVSTSNLCKFYIFINRFN